MFTHLTLAPYHVQMIIDSLEGNENEFLRRKDDVDTLVRIIEQQRYIETSRDQDIQKGSIASGTTSGARSDTSATAAT